MAITNGNYVTPQIPNTTQLEKLRDGILYRYMIQAESGYLLHDNRYDYNYIDPETFEESPRQGFTRGLISVNANYDFNENPYELYTIPDSGEVPDDQIFGGDNNDHETI